MGKASLRAEMRRRLAGQSFTTISERICEFLFVAEVVQQAGLVGLFRSLAGEVRLQKLAERLLAGGKRIAYPRFSEKSQAYELALIDDFEKDFVPGKFGIKEPSAQQTVVSDLREMVCLVPGLAFDLHGHRLGRGGGYYDRLLRNSEMTKIGVACACQLVDLVPVQQHDVCMDYVVTEFGLRSCSLATPHS